MARFVILGAVILNLALFSPCSASEAILGKQAVQTNKSSKKVQGATSSHSVQRENAGGGVVNILVEKIEGGVIYSRGGQKYEITSARVIDNSHGHAATGTEAAELFFENGSLVSVILK
jgi:hypothetical protein